MGPQAGKLSPPLALLASFSAGAEIITANQFRDCVVRLRTEYLVGTKFSNLAVTTVATAQVPAVVLIFF